MLNWHNSRLSVVHIARRSLHTVNEMFDHRNIGSLLLENALLKVKMLRSTQVQSCSSGSMSVKFLFNPP